MKMINIETLKVFMDAAEDAHNQYLNQPKLLGDKPLTGEELEDYNRQSSELLESYNDACRALFTALSLVAKKES